MSLPRAYVKNTFRSGILHRRDKGPGYIVDMNKVPHNTSISPDSNGLTFNDAVKKRTYSPLRFLSCLGRPICIPNP